MSFYKKKKNKGGRYLYAFKDAKKAAQEESAFLTKAKGKAFDTQKYDKQRAEFVNFISTVATCRIVRKARQSGLLDKMTYGDLMDDLSSA